MAYRIEFATSAAKQLKSLARKDLLKIARKIDALKETPPPQGCKKLKGESDLYRLRVGHFRVIYQIQDDRLVILVLNVGHRREVYRNLRNL